MGLVQGATDLGGDGSGKPAPVAQLPGRAHGNVEAATTAILGDQVRVASRKARVDGRMFARIRPVRTQRPVFRPIRFATVVDRKDVRVTQPPDEFDLLAKPGTELG